LTLEILPIPSVLLSVLKTKEANFVNDLIQVVYEKRIRFVRQVPAASSQTTSRIVGQSLITLLIVFPNLITIPGSIARQTKATQNKLQLIPFYHRFLGLWIQSIQINLASLQSYLNKESR